MFICYRIKIQMLWKIRTFSHRKPNRNSIKLHALKSAAKKTVIHTCSLSYIFYTVAQFIECYKMHCAPREPRTILRIGTDHVLQSFIWNVDSVRLHYSFENDFPNTRVFSMEMDWKRVKPEYSILQIGSNIFVIVIASTAYFRANSRVYSLYP